MLIFHSHANKTHFHKKGCALGLILKVRVFRTRRWRIKSRNANRTTMKMASRLIHLISKKTNCTCSRLFLLISKKHVQHAFLSFPCRCFARLQRCFKTSNFLITHYFHGRIFVLFTAAHFHLASRSFLAASISHFLTAALNFHVFLPTKFVSYVFNNSL